MQDDDSLKQGIIDFKDTLTQTTISNRDTASLTMWMKKTSWVNESLCQVSKEKEGDKGVAKRDTLGETWGRDSFVLLLNKV